MVRNLARGRSESAVEQRLDQLLRQPLRSGLGLTQRARG